MTDAVAWADDGIRGHDPRREHDPPDILDLTQMAVLMRATYADGYVAGLTDPSPDTTAACANATTLRLLIPVA